MGTAPLPFNFQRQLPFRTGAVGINVLGPQDPAVVQAILHDSAFPETKDISLSSVALNAQAGQDLQFATGKGSVTFSAQAAASAGLGVYFTPETLLADLQLEEHVGDGFSLTDASDLYYTLLHWGFDAGASAAGAVALGPPSVKFSVDASAGHNFAVIRQFQKKTAAGGVGARTAIEQTVDSWIVPSLISNDSDLKAGTWIYSEADGSFTGSAGVSYGYDFNWVHEAKFAGLQGDIGLKIQLGLSASLGFS